MYPRKIAKNCYAGNILAMKCEHTICCNTHTSSGFWWGYVSMELWVLLVIGGGNLS